MPQKNFTSTLLLGGKGEGKSTAVMEFALDAALRDDFSLVIGNKEKIQKMFSPSLLPAISNIHGYLGLLRFVDVSYADEKDSIFEIMAAVQFYRNIPRIIVIEDLSTLIDPLHTRPRNNIEYLQQVLLIVSHLQDLAASISSPLHRVHLVITDSCEESEYVSLLQRCVDHTAYARYDSETKTVQCYTSKTFRDRYNNIKDIIASGS